MMLTATLIGLPSWAEPQGLQAVAVRGGVRYLRGALVGDLTGLMRLDQ